MRMKQLWIFLILLLIVSVFGALNMNMLEVSAVEYYVVYVDPVETWDEGLDPGMNYTVSIKTNYTGNDIWSYSFTLNYNPNVLHGGINYTDTWTYIGGPPMFSTTHSPIIPYSEKVYLNDTLKTRGLGEDYQISYDFGAIQFNYPLGIGAQVKAMYLYNGLVNGNLITTAVHPNATYQPGDFNNTLGELDLTGAYFRSETEPVPLTSGPGILANVTFTVVGDGFSDITLGDETKLNGWTEGGYGQKYTITDNKQHGFFCNIPPRHDVAVVNLNVPASAAIEQPVPINVTVANEGTYDESVTLTVYNETTVIDSTTFLLEKGLNNTASFSWSTSGLAEDTYTINATATVLVSPENPTGTDDELADNIDTQTVTLQLRHDVAVVSLNVPTSAAIEQPVPIGVTVANEGSYDESVTLTVYNETTVIDSTSFTLAKGPTSKTVSFNWNTSGLAEDTYTINATATVLVSPENPTGTDDELADNIDTKRITLMLIHNVRVVSMTVPPRGNVNDNVLINVTVENPGSYAETFNVTTYYDNTTIVLPNGKNYTTVTLSPAESTTVLFTWNTTGVSAGFYDINATASEVENETNTDDNTRVEGPVLVTILGDVDGDGAVGTSDLIDFNEAYGSEPGDPNWEPLCDFNSDDKVDALDLFILSESHGKSVP